MNSPYLGSILWFWHCLCRWRLSCQFILDRHRFRTQRAEYFDYLHTVLAGVAFKRTLSDVFLADQMRYQHKHWRGRLAAEWRQTYQHSGGDLYAVWQAYLPHDELILLRTAQQADRVGQGLQLLAQYLATLHRHQNMLLSILWPALIGVWVPIVLFLAVPLYTVPALQAVFQDLPTEFYAHYTRHLFFLAEFLQAYGFYLLALCLVVALLLYQCLYRRNNALRRYLDQWSVFRLLRQLAALRLLSLLSILLRPSGSHQLSLLTALEVMQQGAGPWLRWHLHHMVVRINAGYIGALSFNSGLLEVDTYWFFSDMSQAMSVDQAAGRTAQRLSQQLLTQGQSLATRWRWLVLGACVVFSLLMAAWHYVVMNELRQSLSLFYAGM